MPAIAPPDRILVVEDDHDIGLMLLELLALEGYPADLVRTGADAIRALRTTPLPRAIILDYLLGDMTAEQVLAATVVQRGTVPVLIVSIRPRLAAHLADPNVVWIGRKPFNIAALLTQLAAALAARAAAPGTGVAPDTDQG